MAHLLNHYTIFISNVTKEILLNFFGKAGLAEVLRYSKMEYKVALIPECDQKGYSIALIDELGLRILGFLKRPMTIKF